MLTAGGIALVALAVLAALRVDDPWKGGLSLDERRADVEVKCRDAATSLVQPSVFRGCPVLVSDTGSSEDPVPFWGEIDCADDSRHRLMTADGDATPTATGDPQGDASFRRLTIQDGDEVDGERCELGFNNVSGPTAIYHEGNRRVTFISLRIPPGTDVDGQEWRTVMRMKQAQGYRNPDQSPIIEMQVRDGRWSVSNSWNGIWDAPAQQNSWTRFAFDVVYSQDPSVGSIKIYVDLNGDGDASDSGEQSSTMHMPTLRAETAGSGYSDYEVGESIPDHLRAGLYQHPDYSCPSGCPVDVDNVQVVAPSGTNVAG